MWDRWLKVVVALVIGCAIGVGLVALYRPGAARMRELDAQAERLRTQNGELEQEKNIQQHRKELLETDLVTIEMEARSRFGLGKNDETVYVVQDWPEG